MKIMLTDYPEICSEYSETNSRPVEAVTHKTAYKAEWICSKYSDHIWTAQVGSRTGGKGCPYCSGNRVKQGFNDVETTHPHLAKSWSKSNTLSPNSITYGSKKQITWICLNDSDHIEWKTTPNSRSKGRGCPQCAGSKVHTGVNDLATLRPELAREWHESNYRTPSEITCGSSYVALWQCRADDRHTWTSRVAHRVATNTSCIHCFNLGVSKVDRDLREALSKASVLAIEDSYQSSVPVKWGKSLKARVDHLGVLSGGKQIVIEYDGEFWHRDRLENDLLKTMAMLSAGYIVVRVRETPLPMLNIPDKNYYQIEHNWCKQGENNFSPVVSMINSIN